MRYLVLSKHIVYFENYSLVSFSVFDSENNEFLTFDFRVQNNKIEEFRLSKLNEIRTEKYRSVLLAEDSFIILLSKLESLAKQTEAKRKDYLASLENP